MKLPVLSPSISSSRLDFDGVRRKTKTWEEILHFNPLAQVLRWLPVARQVHEGEAPLVFLRAVPNWLSFAQPGLWLHLSLPSRLERMRPRRL